MGNRLATIGMGRKWGGAAVGGWVPTGSPSNTMWPGSRGLPLYQVASWSIQTFGHNCRNATLLRIWIRLRTIFIRSLVVKTFIGCVHWVIARYQLKTWGLWDQRLRKILRVSWTAKKTKEWVLNKAEVKTELLDTVKARKVAYYGHTMRKQGNCLEKEIMQGTMPGVRRRGRPRTAWIDNIKSWTRLSVEKSVRMTEDRDSWRKYVHCVANPRIEDG